MKPLILFAPGAGAPSSHPWMQKWKVRLSEIGNVETFDYDYMRESRKRPDPLPKLIAAHRKALNQARERHPAGCRSLAWFNAFRCAAISFGKGSGRFRLSRM